MKEILYILHAQECDDITYDTLCQEVAKRESSVPALRLLLLKIDTFLAKKPEARLEKIKSFVWERLWMVLVKDHNLGSQDYFAKSQRCYTALSFPEDTLGHYEKMVRAQMIQGIFKGKISGVNSSPLGGVIIEQTDNLQYCFYFQESEDVRTELCTIEINNKEVIIKNSLPV